MGNRYLGLGLLLTCLVLTPALIADDKKPAAKDDKTKHVDADTISAGPYTGKLVDVPDKDGAFTVQVDTSHLVPRDPKNVNKTTQEMQNVARDQAHLAQLEGELARARTAKETQRLSREIDKALAQLQRQLGQAQKTADDVKVQTDHKTVDFQTADSIKVRTMTLPLQYDDQGNIKKYTDEEKTALKGKDTNLPGYEANLSDLKTGDLVRLTLVRKTPPKKADGEKDADSKDKDKDKDAADKKSQVTMIVILNEDKADKDKDTPPKK